MKFYYAVICTVVLINISCDMALAGYKDEKSRDECIQELKLKPEDVELVKTDKVITKEKKTASKDLQCFSSCYFKKVGVVNDKTEVNEKVLTTLLTEMGIGDANVIKAALEKCKTALTGADTCEKVFNYEVCLRGATM